MMRLQSFHGLKDVFGIITNYNEWRICWFSNSDKAALATAISENSEERDRKLEQDDESSFDDVEEPKTESIEVEKLDE